MSNEKDINDLAVVLANLEEKSAVMKIEAAMLGDALEENREDFDARVQNNITDLQEEWNELQQTITDIVGKIKQEQAGEQTEAQKKENYILAKTLLDALNNPTDKEARNAIRDKAKTSFLKGAAYNVARLMAKVTKAAATNAIEIAAVTFVVSTLGKGALLVALLAATMKTLSGEFLISDYIKKPLDRYSEKSEEKRDQFYKTSETFHLFGDKMDRIADAKRRVEKTINPKGKQPKF